ncbi:hypothetical protein GCM10025866_28050 [Naasia aerilata]|uniref:DUF3000 family protein n=1 Tax=Naasia aerilata TaxID=1162966 RepID=A0ABN6XPV9_9MICO|nr:hypothetical protein GCM10025866_28050 [Naasia aerilata]
MVPPRDINPPAEIAAPPAEFAAALDSIEQTTIRSDVVIEAIPAPTGLAPWSVALSADVNPTPHGMDLDLGTGRLVLLYDPEEPEAWGGRFRIVCFAQAPSTSRSAPIPSSPTSPGHG